MPNYCNIDVHRSANVEHVVNIHNILHYITSEQHRQYEKTNLLYYLSGKLAFQVKLNDGTWLIVLNVTREHLVKLVMELNDAKKVFVRHHHHHLFFGFYSAFYDDCWVIQYVDLKKQSVTKPIILHNFEGTEFGDDVCFGIFDNALYAVSSYMNNSDMDA